MCVVGIGEREKKKGGNTFVCSNTKAGTKNPFRRVVLLVAAAAATFSDGKNLIVLHAELGKLWVKYSLHISVEISWTILRRDGKYSKSAFSPVCLYAEKKMGDFFISGRERLKNRDSLHSKLKFQKSSYA